MSRQLPDRPDLDHLKNQAKDLLAELRSRTPETQLADAQFALAREYGFASWTKLKAHVESTRTSLAGRWSASLEKSRPHPLNPFRMASLEIRLEDDHATFAFVSLDPRGAEHRGEPTVVIDGEHHVMEHGVGYVAKWLGPGALEVTATKNGQPTGRGLYEVSPNGQALTVSYAPSPANRSPAPSRANRSPEAEHRLVFDRMLA
jgi:hypothetical protein